MDKIIYNEDGYAELQTFEIEGVDAVSTYGFYIQYNDSGKEMWSTQHRFIESVAREVNDGNQ